jgi:hypothetical protein
VQNRCSGYTKKGSYQWQVDVNIVIQAVTAIVPRARTGSMSSAMMLARGASTADQPVTATALRAQAERTRWASRANAVTADRAVQEIALRVHMENMRNKEKKFSNIRLNLL